MSFAVTVIENGIPVTLNGVAEDNLSPDLFNKINEKTNIATAAATTATINASQSLTNANNAAISANNTIPLAETATTQAGIATTKANESDIDAAIVAADKATVAADKAIVAADKVIVAANKTTSATNATNAATSASSVVALPLTNSTGLPTIRPTVFLDFANARRVSPIITFTRNSIATYFDSRGVMQTARINQPRIDFNPLTGECLGLLMEETRTNLTLNGSYTASSGNITVTPNSGISPSGANDAISVANVINSLSIFTISGSGTPADGIYTNSIFVKPNGSNATISFNGVGGSSGEGGQMTFNAITKVWSGNTTFPISYGNQDFPNGWIRIWVVIEKSPTKIIGSSRFVIGGYGSQTIQHNLLLWGAQFELGAFITSYIPTTTAAVTRGSESSVISGLGMRFFQNKNQGTFYLEGRGGNNSAGGQVFRGTFLSGASNSMIGGNGANRILSWDGVTDFGYSTDTFPRDFFFKAALGYNLNGRRLCINGGGIVTNANYNTNWYGTDIITIGGRNTSYSMNGHLKCVYFYPILLTDSQIQSLTTL